MGYVAAFSGRPIEVGIHMILGDIPHAGVLTTWSEARPVDNKSKSSASMRLRSPIIC